jgi:purine nucleosidase
MVLTGELPFPDEMRAKRALAKRPLPAGFPSLGTSMAERLEPPKPGRVAMVLDTDTFNEIDDQFAIVQALLSPERLDLRAIYAAPFYNGRSDSYGDGMEKSYEEILELLTRMDVEPEGLVHRGSTAPLADWEHPIESAAASDLIAQAKAMPEGELLYVVAIAAITNVASAILLDPSIIEKVVVVWLGGTANDWPQNLEYNLQGDLKAAQLVMDCGVPLVRLPCAGVVTHLHSTIPEIDTYVKGKGAIGDCACGTLHTLPNVCSSTQHLRATNRRAERQWSTLGPFALPVLAVLCGRVFSPFDLSVCRSQSSPCAFVSTRPPARRSVTARSSGIWQP